MWGILQVLAAWCLMGIAAEPDKSVLQGLHWCNTMCMCRAKTQDQVQCFERAQMFEFLGFDDKMTRKLLRSKWKTEEKVYWCNDLCLCHIGNDREFQCVQEDDVTRLIHDHIGHTYFYDRHVDVEERAIEPQEELEQAQHAKESEKKKNKKKNKPKKPVKAREEVEVFTTVVPAVEVETEPTTEQVMFIEPTTTTSTTTTTTTPSTPVHDMNSGGEDMEEEAELLPKQEAVAASPAVTAMQPPTRRQPFPPTVTAHTPHASTREVHTLPPKVSAVLEVPVERKTVASEVSQNLDELGSTVMQIKNDVVMNQRILLVTVAIAAIAMLGVLILAIHGCSRRRQPPPDTKKRDAAKEDNHATKVNLEQAW